MLDILNKKVVCAVTRIFLSPVPCPHTQSTTFQPLASPGPDWDRHLRRQNTLQPNWLLCLGQPVISISNIRLNPHLKFQQTNSYVYLWLVLFSMELWGVIVKPQGTQACGVFSPLNNRPSFTFFKNDS